ncbi:Acyl-coenzyme A thioesterase PaaI [Corynebacterium kalinowskii]|uniref:Acyl-coenzyme A thioesterase PaaI n=1 Tax=Corynebacterium kalinowskii TaxID=2675216 RepID=A0A6B8VGE0_9CORY|nr:hotdog fold thioesterase [Corynebacterium kalinowskii]QGU03213.1 Acyl-coenzyme A thioesterase PaaI [Corynebacterium kalinowskii]
MTYQILSPKIATGDQFAHVRTMFNNDHASNDLGLKITQLSDGLCAGSMAIQERFCNGHGSIHGGYLFAFADSLFAGACNTDGDVAVATHNSIHYIAPAFTGQQLDGIARRSHQWGRNGFVDVEVTCEGKPIASFRGTFRVLPGKPTRR